MKSVLGLVALAFTLALVNACSGGNGGTKQAVVRQPEHRFSALDDADPAAVALAASRTFFEASPVVVLLAPDDPAAGLRGSSAAVALGVPALIGGDDRSILSEIDRLGARWVLAFGAPKPQKPDGEAGKDVPDPKFTHVPAPDGEEALAKLLDRKPSPATAVETDGQVAAIIDAERGSYAPLELKPADASTPAGSSPTSPPKSSESVDTKGFPNGDPPPPLTGVIALVDGSAAHSAAAATAKAAGAALLLTPNGDPRSTTESVSRISAAKKDRFVAIGPAFGDAETLTWRLETAMTGLELPGGGQLVFPGKLYVALYGTPTTGSLGVLGKQDVPATVKRAEDLAAEYVPLTEDTVVPSLEIIATIATGDAGPDGDYSNELSIDKLRPLVDAAHEAAQYIVLDLQPGRASFLEQAKLYEELLKLPYVGLALDPEWNLGPDQVHLKQIGSTTAAEINEVVTWLADLTRKNHLPQKMLILHQFQVRMIKTVAEVDQSRSELAVLVHADGQGTQPQKQDTWRTLHANGTDIRWWGWKNFYEKDKPMLTPEQTAKVEPFPNFISYQ